jgi:hypothetical protein
MDDPRAAKVRESNKPYVLDDWQALVAAGGKRGEHR